MPPKKPKPDYLVRPKAQPNPTAIAEAETPFNLNPEDEGLTILRRRFVDAYVSKAMGSGKKAAILAGYSPNGAAQTAANMLKDQRVRDAINRRLAFIENAVSAEEVLGFWSDAMRGEATEEVLGKDGEVREVKTGVANRLKASELLAKYYGLTAPQKIEVEVRDNRAELAAAIKTIAEKAGVLQTDDEGEDR